MILFGALLLQTALSGAPAISDSLAVVTSSAARVAIAVERNEDGREPALPVGPLALALDGVVSALPNSRFNFHLGGITVELVDGLPFARVGEAVHPMAHAPRLREGSLLVPPQFARELIPRLLPLVRWDSSTMLLHAPLRVASADAGTEAASQSGDAPSESRPPDRQPPRRGALSPIAGDPEPGGTTVLPTIRGEGARTGPPTSPASASASRPVRTPGDRQYTIVVDAGHGGVDNGMSGPIARSAPRLYEKRITMSVSQLVEAELKSRGYRVVMTRTRDTLIALSDRGRIANREQGDLFLSIHVNAANPRWSNAGSARGFETYFLAEAKTEDARRVEQMENDAARFETESEVSAGDPLSFIVTDMQQNEHLRESKELAAAVQEHLQRIHPGPNRGVKQAAFTVLVSAFMPSVLIELGFGTNEAEARWLSDTVQQGRIANAIVDAAEEYLAAFELRASGGQ